MSSNVTGTTAGAGSSSSSNNEGWIITVIVVGIIIFIALHVLLVVVIIWYRRSKRRDSEIHISESNVNFIHLLQTVDNIIMLQNKMLSLPALVHW